MKSRKKTLRRHPGRSNGRKLTVQQEKKRLWEHALVCQALQRPARPIEDIVTAIRNRELEARISKATARYEHWAVIRADWHVQRQAVKAGGQS